MRLGRQKSWLEILEVGRQARKVLVEGPILVVSVGSLKYRYSQAADKPDKPQVVIGQLV